MFNGQKYLDLFELMMFKLITKTLVNYSSLSYICQLTQNTFIQTVIFIPQV